MPQVLVKMVELAQDDLHPVIPALAPQATGERCVSVSVYECQENQVFVSFVY